MLPPHRRFGLILIFSPFSFTEKLLKAIKGAKGLVEPSYVYLPGVPGGKEIAEKTGVEFFSVPIELGVRKATTRAFNLD